MNLEDAINGIGAGMGAGLLFMTYLIPFVIILAVSVVICAVTYALYAVAFSKTADKLNYGKKYLAFIPFVQTYTCLYMLSEFSGRQDFSITPSIDEKIKIKNRNTSFIIAILAPIIISTVSTVISFILGLTIFLSFLAPVISSLLSVVVFAVVGAAVFVYMRDFLDMFEEDKNKTTLLSVLCMFVGLAIPIILLVYLKKEPVYVAPEEYQYEPAGEPTYY